MKKTLFILLIFFATAAVVYGGPPIVGGSAGSVEVSGDALSKTGDTISAHAEVEAVADSKYIATQSATVDDGNTLAPTASQRRLFVALTCSSDPSAITLGETSIEDDTVLYITNVGSNTCTFAGSSGVQETPVSLTVEQYETCTWKYETDRWVLVSYATADLPVNSIEVPTLLASELNDTSDPHTLTEAELKNTILSNSESTGADEWDFPARGEGWNFMFIKEADQNITLDPNGSEQYYFRTDNSAYSQLAAGEAIVNTTAGKSSLSCFSTESAVYCTGDENWAEASP